VLANLAGIHRLAGRGCGKGRHGSKKDADTLTVPRFFQRRKWLKYQEFNTLNTTFNAVFAGTPARVNTERRM
jgi:hypothetical protein